MIGLKINHFIALLLTSFGSQVKSDASDHHYSEGDKIPVYANNVGPYSNPLETYPYYDFPFCSPDDVKEKKVNLGGLLSGKSPDLTPYKFEFLVEKEFELLCKKRLGKADVSQFRSVVDKDYIMHLYYDDLPFHIYVGMDKINSTFEGIKRRSYFLFKHYNFDIFYNKSHVIDLRVRPDPNSILDVTEDKEVDVAFTYSVRWMVTPYSFDDRMQRYEGFSNQFSLADLTEDTRSIRDVHGYSIANSSFTIFILIIFMLFFYKRVLHKDISRYANDVEEAEVADNEERTGWKNIHGDVFRFPKHKSLFAAALGSGTQLLVLIAAFFSLSIMGVFQPYLQGVFLNALGIIYAVTFVVSGYTSVCFYHQLEGTSSMKNLLLTGGLYFGPLFLTFNFNNTIAIFNESTTALPLGEVIALSLLWILLAFPLLLLGAFIGKNKKTAFQPPCRTSKCPREVPKQRWHKGILPQMILAGFIPFSVIIIQLHDILYIVWDHGIYTFYNSMAVEFFLLLITTILVSVMMTYFQLAAEDHEWWWRSFFYGGSTGLYVYGYSIYYYFCLSDMNSFMQTCSFFGYMACLSYGIFLALGTVGFHASFLFVRCLYATIKCE